MCMHHSKDHIKLLYNHRKYFEKVSPWMDGKERKRGKNRISCLTHIFVHNYSF
jgi:hypothetical protein